MEEQDMVASDLEQSFTPQTEQPEVSSPPFDIDWIEPEEPAEEWPIEGVYDTEVPQKDTGKISSGYFSRTDEEWKETKIGTLPNGNTIYVQKKPDGHGYYVSQRPGNTPPKELHGTFTSYFVAEREARTFISKKIDEHNAKVATN